MDPRQETGVTSIPSEAPLNYMMAPRNEINPIETVPVPLPPPNQGLVMSSSDKKKRGRPRKYGADGVIGGSRPLSPMPISTANPTTGYLAENPQSAGGGGRPVTSEKKQKPRVVVDTESGDIVPSVTGGGFLPHIITVNADEDVSMKIISFCQQGPRAICIISATGMVSNVTLREPNSSGGTMTYQGRFDILSLSGSFTPMDIGGSRTGRCGGMSISLASNDRRVFGGTLAGLLTAASPVQVVVGSFLPSNCSELKPKKQKYEQRAASGTAPPSAAPSPTPVTTAPAPASAAVAPPPPSHHPNHHPNNGVHGMNGGNPTPSMMHTDINTSNWSAMVEDDSRLHTDINIPLQGP